MQNPDFRALFDASPYPCLLLDQALQIVAANPACLRVTGHGIDIVGKPLPEALPEWGAEGRETLLHEVLASGTAMLARNITLARHSVADASTPDGYLDLMCQPLYATDGRVEGIFVQGHDVTERVTEHMRAEEQLQDADRRRDEFLAMLAHELRNPLAPISAASQLLKMPNVKPELIRRTSDVIGRQVGHLTSLVDDLLDVSRVTRGLVSLERKRLSVREMVTDAVEQVRPMIEARAQELSVHLPPQAIELDGDQKRLVQVLTNLLNNASKYTAERGRLALDVTATQGSVTICISDNGIGITPEVLPHVFDLFTQAERTPDRSQGGLGLGLALVRSLVALHGGTVSASSPGKGEGASFTVCLPRIDDIEADGRPADPATAMPQRDGGLRLLVVDDNTDAAEMLGAFMESAGHAVTIAHEPFVALERARVDRPDVCLLDIGLPGMDGNQLARRLRLMPHLSNTTLIAVTGYGKEFDRDTSITAGFDYYFVKPADPVALVALLDKIHVQAPG